MKIKTLMMVLPMLVALCAQGRNESNNVAYINTYQRGLDAVKQGNLEKARACFSTALFYKPGDANAQKGLEMTEERLHVQQSQRVENNNDSKEWFLRLSAGTAPGLEKDPDQYGEYAKDDGAPDHQIEALVVRRYIKADDSRFGSLLGAGMFFAYHTGEDQLGDSYDATGLGFMAQAGVATRLGEYLVVELDPYAGFGVGLLSGYVHYGIKGGIYIPVGNHELGMEVGYAGFYTGPVSGRGLRIAAVFSF